MKMLFATKQTLIGGYVAQIGKFDGAGNYKNYLLGILFITVAIRT